MNSEDAKRVIYTYYNKDNLSKEDDFSFVEANKFLIETENDAQAMSCLGGYYYGKEKYDLAEKYYLMAFNNGDKYASTGLGFIYYYGRTGERDFKKAFHYFSISKDKGDKEAAMKLADMYRNGYGTEKNDAKYKELILELYKDVENTDDLYDPYPELAHRLADIYINEGHGEDAINMLLKAKSFIAQRIRYNPFWGNFIVCRRVITLLYKVIPFDETSFDFFDLFYYLYTPRSVSLLYNGKRYKITSYLDEDQIRVESNGFHYKSIEDFLANGLFDNKHIYVIHYEDAYLLESL